jgi:hypothetical protein
MKRFIKILAVGLAVTMLCGMFSNSVWARDSFGFSFGYSSGGSRHGGRVDCGPWYYGRPGVSYGYSYHYYAPPPPPRVYYGPPPVVYREYYYAPQPYYYYYGGGTYYSY